MAWAKVLLLNFIYTFDPKAQLLFSTTEAQELNTCEHLCVTQALLKTALCIPNFNTLWDIWLYIFLIV